jgi:hypothetical protein
MQRGAVDYDFIASVVERWRGTTSGTKFRLETSPFDPQLSAQAPTVPVMPPRLTGGVDPERFSLLKKQISIRKEVVDPTKVPR